MNRLGTVIRFTFMNRFRSKPFIITSIIFMLLITIGVNLPSMITQFTKGNVSKIGMLQSQDSQIQSGLHDYFASLDNSGILIVLMQDQGSAAANDQMIQEKIKQKDIQGFLKVLPGPQGDFPKLVYQSEGSPSISLKSKLETALKLVKTEIVVKNSGISQSQLQSLLSPVNLQTEQISLNSTGGAGPGNGKTENQMIMAYIMVYALIFLIFIGITMYGNLIATEITAEKSSRVMELLISSASPLQQMFGKVIGMLLISSIQIFFFIAVAAINLFLPNNRAFIAQQHIFLHDIPLSLIVYFLIFYLLGFFL